MIATIKIVTTFLEEYGFRAGPQIYIASYAPLILLRREFP